MASAGSRYIPCAIREGLLERLCDAVLEHANVSRGLNQFVGQHPGFKLAKGNARDYARIARDCRSDYDEHRRNRGC
jgi:hypothetical protein